MGAIHAIEIAQNKGWNNLWLETDSKLVQLAFKTPFLVPWMLNTLANLGLNLDTFCWWDAPPPQIAADLHCNKFGFPKFRF
ncbi:heat-shock protein, partial [Trifolium medium]|nr:heat-shock protein [Trifolium medium]